MTKVDHPDTQLTDKTANAIRDVPDLIRRRSLHIVFASTSGHTEYVVDTLIDSLKGIVPAWDIEKKMAEKTQPQGSAERGCPRAHLRDLEHGEHRGAAESPHVAAAWRSAERGRW